MHGGAGNDVLNGGIGDDTLVGGEGIDTADYSYRTGAITVTLTGSGDGTTQVGSVTETLTDIENLTGGSGGTRSSATPAPMCWTAAAATTCWTAGRATTPDRRRGSTMPATATRTGGARYADGS